MIPILTQRTPYWFYLIDYWVNIRKRTGLTLPFIIGVPNAFEIKDAQLYTVREILGEISSGIIDKVFTLQYCGDIMEYVIGLHNRDLQIQVEVQSSVTNKVNLVTTLNAASLGKALDEICTTLETRYAECIYKKWFSRTNLKWHEYSTEDISMIKNALDFKTL